MTTLAEQVQDVAQTVRFGCDPGIAGALVEELADKVAKLEKAVVAFDLILFPTDGWRDPADTAHMREQLVNDLAESMDRHGWAGTPEENVRFIERLATILKEGK